MSFSEVRKALKEGHKIRRKGWDEYWVIEDQICPSTEIYKTVVLHTKDGRDINLWYDIEYMLTQITYSDWEIVPEYTEKESNNE